MKYNGQELTPITTPQIFDPPREMLVWDEGGGEPQVKGIWGIAPPSANLKYPVVTTNCVTYGYCAEIPEAPKQKRAKNIQFMEWLAKGYGIWKRKGESHTFTNAPILEDLLGEEVEKYVLIRPFGTTEWLEPTLENMGMEEKDENGV